MQPRHAVKFGCILGQAVRLPVIDHLQPVLDGAQQFVGRGQDLRIIGTYPLTRRQRCQGRSGVGHAQAGIAAAVDQLMRLREKFAFANAASSALQIIAGAKLLPLMIMVAYLPAHVANIGNLSEIQTAPPDERLNAFQEIIAQRAVARCRRAHG